MRGNGIRAEGTLCFLVGLYVVCCDDIKRRGQRAVAAVILSEGHHLICKGARLRPLPEMLPGSWTIDRVLSQMKAPVSPGGFDVTVNVSNASAVLPGSSATT